MSKLTNRAVDALASAGKGAKLPLGKRVARIRRPRDPFRSEDIHPPVSKRGGAQPTYRHRWYLTEAGPHAAPHLWQRRRRLGLFRADDRSAPRPRRQRSVHVRRPSSDGCLLSRGRGRAVAVLCRLVWRRTLKLTKSLRWRAKASAHLPGKRQRVEGCEQSSRRRLASIVKPECRIEPPFAPVELVFDCARYQS